MIPDYCDAITAYRAWDVLPNGLLVGQAHNEPWPPFHALQARCWEATLHHLREGQWIGAPVLDCHCGIYALRSYDWAEARVRESYAISIAHGLPYLQHRRVWGTVKLWGRVIEHEGGYRAECAYPSELWCEHAALAKTIATLYGVPCNVRELPKPKLDLTVFDNSGSGIIYVPSSAGNVFFKNNVIQTFTPSAGNELAITFEESPLEESPPVHRPWWRFWR